MDYLRRPSATDNKPSMARPEPAARRLSTPAGQRLSVIMESGQLAGKGAPYNSLDGSTLRPGSRQPGVYGLDQWSDSTPEQSEQAEKFQQLRHNRHLTSRGGWKRLALITTLILLAIIGIVVGVVVGVQNRNRSRDDSANASSQQQPLPSSPADTSPSRPNDPSNPSNTPSEASSLSTDPTGLHTALVFLNNIQTNCTTLSATWTCYPGTTYQLSRTRSAVPFIYNITRSTSSTSPSGFTIQSSENPQQITLEPTELEKINDGQEDEHWRFTSFIDKTVQTARSLTSDSNLALCTFSRTTYIGYLYTRANRDFSIEQVEGQASNVWPFKARVEQTKEGGEGTPECYRLTNGVAGERIEEGLQAEDPSAMCSCMWKS